MFKAGMFKAKNFMKVYKEKEPEPGGTIVLRQRKSHTVKIQ